MMVAHRAEEVRIGGSRGRQLTIPMVKWYLASSRLIDPMKFLRGIPAGEGDGREPT